MKQRELKTRILQSRFKTTHRGNQRDTTARTALLSQTSKSTSCHPSDSASICQSCGACCATFRVSFYWAEAEVLKIPAEMITPLTPVYSCLNGTQQAQPRCTALLGTIGESVSCQMYLQRPSPCHEVQVGDERCIKARAHHGLSTTFLTQEPEQSVLATAY